eukprot:14071836-Alexandrium_andersonii.AAC.1
MTPLSCSGQRGAPSRHRPREAARAPSVPNGWPCTPPPAAALSLLPPLPRGVATLSLPRLLRP